MRSESGQLTPRFDAIYSARKQQNMGLGSVPNPISSRGEPPGTRTPNPLIKSQPAGGDVPRTRSAPGLARSLACAKSPMGQLFDGHSCLNSTEIRPNAQVVHEFDAHLTRMMRDVHE